MWWNPKVGNVTKQKSKLIDFLKPSWRDDRLVKYFHALYYKYCKKKKKGFITAKEIPFLFKSWFTSVYNDKWNKTSQILNQCKVAGLYRLQWHRVNSHLP